MADSMEDMQETSMQRPAEPRFVNKALRAPAMCPRDPQAWLHRSTHPYSPFVGNALTWESYVYDDGTTYEGLCREEVPHGKGVLTMGNGSGGGFQITSKGDTYEGEFYAGFAHGLGQYVSADTKEIYRGEFYAGKRQGCGMAMNITPYTKMVKKGMDPTLAWEKSKDRITGRAKYGTWRKDYYVAEPDEKGHRYCHINEIKSPLLPNAPRLWIRGTLEELEAVLTQARMFKWKPDGEVTYLFAQDANGLPLNLLQDPLHYPYGTHFMAPGPAGQCHNVPDDENLKKEMLFHATNYQRIHDMYNLDWDPPPGSNLYKALAYRKEKNRRRKQEEEEEASKTASARAARGSPSGGTYNPASISMGIDLRNFGKALRNAGGGLMTAFSRPRFPWQRPQD